MNFFKWSKSHTSYELSSLSKNIIYKIFTNFNESIYRQISLAYYERYMLSDVVEYSISKNISQTMISEYKLKLIDKKLLETKPREMKNLIDNNYINLRVSIIT